MKSGKNNFDQLLPDEDIIYIYIKKNENHPSGCGYGSIRAKLHYTI